jgi:Co/Zn/Cd efflux system component
VAIWAKGLVLQTGQVLVDREMDHPVVDEIREAVGEIAPLGQLRLTDLHVWRVGRQAYACALTVVTTLDDLTPRRVRQALRQHEEIRHATIEVHHVRDLGGLAAASGHSPNDGLVQAAHTGHGPHHQHHHGHDHPHP